MIVRTDLDHKRAEKLAKRNPKKERSRPGSGISRRAAPPAPVEAPVSGRSARD